MTVLSLDDFRLDCIYIVEAKLSESKTNRGTCFSIGHDLLLTAAHVVNNADLIEIFLNSDNYALNKSIKAIIVYNNPDLDVAILSVPEGTIESSIELYSTSVGLDSEVKTCGYPVEKEHYHAPFKVKVTNTFTHMAIREFSFELSQSNTVSRYSGMSGSPIIYGSRCIGILLIQQGGNTLYALSVKDFLNDIGVKTVFEKNSIAYFVQDGIEYRTPDYPKSPFKYCINCNLGEPNIKGIDIGFTLKKWNVNKFAETTYDWIIDYCLSHKERRNFNGSARSLFKYARSHYPADDLKALGDLCLHMAIRESYSTIPIMSKVFDTNNKTFSCTHAVLNFDQIELWIGASSVALDISQATTSAIESIKYIMDLRSLTNRLITLTTEIDDSWPHKEKLKRLADSTLELDKRFDKIIIPIFIMHDSELINNYSESNFLTLFNNEISNCRSLLQTNIDGKLVDLIDLRVFYFPVSNIIEINQILEKELNS